MGDGTQRHSHDGGPDHVLTGAHAAACVLDQEGIRLAFAYPGTSELALCDAVDRTAGIDLVSGRGDTEAAFMAAGACALTPCAAAGILHGARGLTNALGAIATARRNEVGVVYLVGMPSTGSACFLPPHGEPDLIGSAGRFAKWSYELGAPDTSGNGQTTPAHYFTRSLRAAIRIARARPCGPVLVGIPQNTLETRWVPQQVVLADAPHEAPRAVPALSSAVALIEGCGRRLILLDDYFLRYAESRPALREFAELLGAPVLQVRYRRGPMLFERLSRSDVPLFVGWYDALEAAHRELMEQAELVITLEDRNMYPRVIGPLPACRKLVITTDRAKSCKNAYVGSDDIVVEGDVCEILRRLSALLRPILTTSGAARRGTWDDGTACGSSVDRVVGEQAVPSAALHLRRAIASSFARAFDAVSCPMLVDDSQMFGGLLAEEYDQYPPRLRVFGDHAGFVGSGISFATGLAASDPALTVVCTLGDQGFCNGLQGLVALGEQRVPLTLVVCNNGESVSLRKQALTIDPGALQGGIHAILRNPPNIDYQALAAALQVDSSVVAWTSDMEPDETEQRAAELQAQLVSAFHARQPRLIELRLPPLGTAWHGIWRTEGLEQLARQAH
ncbi:MAG TPA: thiamine pyrophosphate-binding protein [Herpetosiphonaceae bacterium]